MKSLQLISLCEFLAEELLCQTLLKTFCENFLWQFASDENHLGVFLFAGQPGFARLCAHHHVHALKQHATIDAFHVQDPVIAQ